MANQIKTSDSDPIQINWIEIGTGWGQIAMTLCPGKKQTDGISGRWNRDLAKDLGDIKKWGAKKAYIEHIEAILRKANNVIDMCEACLKVTSALGDP